MTEASYRIPEAEQMWRPKAKLSPEAAEAKIDRSAAFIQDLHESRERYFEKSARRAEADKPRITLYALFLGLLGATLTARAEDVGEGDAKSGDVNPNGKPRHDFVYLSAD